MRKLIKICSLLLVAAITLSCFLTGCQSNEKPKTPNEPIVDTENTFDDKHSGPGNNKGDITKIDPFDNILFSMSGPSGQAYWASHIYTIFRLPDGSVKTITVLVDVPENDGSLKNGDKLHCHLQENVDCEMLKKNYGIELTRTEADIELFGLNEYGQPGASAGEHKTINLNEYVKITQLGQNGNGSIRVEINYDLLLRENSECFRTDVAPEYLIDELRPSWCTAEYIFKNKNPFLIGEKGVAAINPTNGMPFVEIRGAYSNGEVVNLTWQINNEHLTQLTKVMNADFVYEDFDCTISGLQ